MSNRNIVVLGADGLLASDLIELLQYDGTAVVRVYSKELCDVTKYKNVYYNLVGETTHVINCAALNDIELCEKSPELATAVNDKAVKNLTEVCLDNKIHLTHFSTAQVYNGNKLEPYLENDPTEPLSVYAKSKLAGDSHVLSMGDKGLVIRTNWLFGKFRPNLVNTVMSNLEKNIVTELEDDEIGNPTYTLDLANTVLSLALSNKSGTYNVTNSEQCSKYELGMKLAEYLEKKDLIKAKKSTNVLMPKFTVLSNNRLIQTLPETLRPWHSALYQYLLEVGKVQ